MTDVAANTEDPGAEREVGLKTYLDGLSARLAQAGSSWVRCELLALRASGRWVRWEFTESKDARMVARAAGGCSPATHARIAAAFAGVGITLGAGREILVHVQPRLSAAYGLELYVLDVDVRFSRGDIATRADAIREDLRRAGAWGLNRDLRRPADYVSVAVVAPPGSAGGGDFRAVVAGLERLRLTAFTYVETPFQGPAAAAGIVACLSSLVEDCRNGRFDAVVLVRGGGASADLAHLIDRGVVEAVCRMPVPVLTGIGHDRDVTMLDEVACVPCATPTRAAQHIRQVVADAATAADRARLQSRSHAAAALELLRRGAGDRTAAVASGAIQRLRAAETGVAGSSAGLRPGSSRILAQAERQLANEAARIARAARFMDGAARAAIASLSRAIRTGAREACGRMGTDVAALGPRGLAPALQQAARRAAAARTAAGAAAGTMLRVASADVARCRSDVRVAQAGTPDTASAGVAAAAAAIAACATQTLQTAQATVAAVGSAAQMLDPAAVLARGYALIRGPGGKLVTGAGELAVGPAAVRVEFRDGVADVQVINVRKVKS